ncbi:MAG: BMP family ABC transporter substrate-binding protein [Armatimonas sp.]
MKTTRRSAFGALAAIFALAGCAQQEAPKTTDATPAPGASPAATSTSTVGIPPAPEGAFKIGLVTPSKITDTAWSGPANDAVQSFKTSLGAEPTPTIESPGKADVEGAIRKLAESGDQLIFLHASEYDEAAKAVAPSFPKTTFVVVGGREVAGNVTPIQFAPGQATYLAGMVAAGMSKTGKIACIGGDEIPIIKEAFASFEKGAKAVNPKIEVKIVFTGDGNDIPKAKQQAEALIAEKCDVLSHNANAGGQGVAQVVMEKGGYFIGANSLQNDLATPKNLGSFVLDTKAAYTAVAEKVKAGKGEGKPYVVGLKEKAVSFVFNDGFAGKIPDDLKAKVKQAEADIIAGKVSP